MLFSVFLIFAKFTRESSFKIQFISHLELDNDFSALFEPFKDENIDITNDNVKAASLEIIRNLIFNGPSEELREIMAKSSFLKIILRRALDQKNDVLKGLALDCLLSSYDLVVQGLLLLDDLVFDLDKVFDEKNLINQRKLFIFIGWGLYTESIDFSIIKQGFLNKVVSQGFRALEEGDQDIFSCANFIVVTLLSKNNWSEIVQAMQYYEKYLTSQVNKKAEVTRAWLQGLCLLACHNSFITTIKSNPNLIKYLWFEINEHCHDFNLEVIMLVKSTLQVPILLEKYNEEVFMSKLLAGFINSYHSYPGDNMIMVALEVFNIFSKSTVVIKVLLKNVGFSKCLRTLWMTGNNPLNKLTARIFREMIASSTVEEINFMLKDKKYQKFTESFGILLKYVNQLKIGAFTSDVIKNLEKLEKIPYNEFETQNYTMKDLEVELDSVFEPQIMLMKKQLIKMIDDVTEDFRKI